MSFYTAADLDVILRKYEKYWANDKMTDHELFKNLDVTYLSSNYKDQKVPKIFNDLTYKIEIDESNQSDSYKFADPDILTNNMLDKSNPNNWKNLIYEKLLALEDNNELKIKNDSYIIIDLNNELLTLIFYCKSKEAKTLVGPDIESALEKLLELNNNNVFGIEYMFYRSNQFQKLNLNIIPSTKISIINSHELFKFKHKLNLIDNLLDEKNYYGYGKEKNAKDEFEPKVEEFAKSLVKNTQYHILITLKEYISKFFEENNTEIEKFIPDPKATTDQKFIINGEGKNIYMIGDIHGDFPRLVQLLYNAKFINFEGPVWAKLNILDPKKIREYMHSKDIFKEVVWLPNNVLLLSTGDLVDSKREINKTEIDASSYEGDYELRIHLLLFLLREQAIKKDSFVHFILGNHDRTLLMKEIATQTSTSCTNNFFNGYMNRFNTLKQFYVNKMSSYAFIKIKSNPTPEYIFIAHGSLFFKMDNYSGYNYKDLSDFDTAKDPAKIEKIEKIKKLDEDRSTILNFMRLYNDEGLYKIYYSYLESIKDLKNIEIDETLKKNTTFKALIDVLTKSYDAWLIYLKKPGYKELYDTVEKLLKNTNSINFDDISNSTIEEKMKEFNLNSESLNKLLFVTDDYSKSISLQFINETDSNIKYAVFGHQITSHEDFTNMMYNQTGYTAHHTILSSCECKLNFIDIALSEAFGKSNNIFYELFHFGNDRPARLRIYTSDTKYMIGAPLPAEIYEYEDMKKIIPVLKDKGTPVTF
jgi:hypothetical protein